MSARSFPVPMIRMRLIHLCTVLLAATVLPTAGFAQDAQRPHVTTSAGLFQYELSSRGLSPMLAVRAAMPVGSVLMLEGGMFAARPKQPGGGNATLLAPEAQVQLLLPFTRFLPYIGLGVGAVVDLRDSLSGGTSADLGISGALGMRAWLRENTGFQLEFRGRGIGTDFAKTSSEYTVGLLLRI